MKKLLSILVMMLCTLAMSAQEEKHEYSRPLTDIEVVRRVDRLDIEGIIYRNVEVTLKPITPDYLINDKYKVKVVVRDTQGKKIWKRTLKGVFLYVFSTGQIQVAKQNFIPILIWQPSIELGGTTGTIREREGVY